MFRIIPLKFWYVELGGFNTENVSLLSTGLWPLPLVFFCPISETLSSGDALVFGDESVHSGVGHGVDVCMALWLWCPHCLLSHWVHV